MYELIKKAVITEKSSEKNDKGVYVFMVSADANKIEIKKTIKAIYNADVKSVNIVKMPRKTRLGRKRLPVTKRSQYKKAIITLKNNKTIDINVFAKEEKTKK